MIGPRTIKDELSSPPRIAEASHLDTVVGDSWTTRHKSTFQYCASRDSAVLPVASAVPTMLQYVRTFCPQTKTNCSDTVLTLPSPQYYTVLLCSTTVLLGGVRAVAAALLVFRAWRCYSDPAVRTSCLVTPSLKHARMPCPGYTVAADPPLPFLDVRKSERGCEGERDRTPTKKESYTSDECVVRTSTRHTTQRATPPHTHTHHV